MEKKFFDEVIKIAENKLSAFGSYNEADFEGYISYCIGTNYISESMVIPDWCDIKKTLIEDGYYYCYWEESIVTKSVALELGIIE